MHDPIKRPLLTRASLFAGPFPVLCLMIGSVVTRLVPDEGPPANITGFEGLSRDEQRVLVASSVTFLAGIMQVSGITPKTSNMRRKMEFGDRKVVCQYHHCKTTSSHDNPLTALISICLPAGHGCPAGGLCRHVPVRHSGVWLHHCSCHPHPSVTAQVCVGTASPRHQWAPGHCIRKDKLL